MSDTNQNSWTNGKSENYEDGWYQDEYGEWLNEFDWHQDENGEWYYEDSYDYEADGWKQVREDAQGRRTDGDGRDQF